MKTLYLTTLLLLFQTTVFAQQDVAEVNFASLKFSSPTLFASSVNGRAHYTGGGYVATHVMAELAALQVSPPQAARKRATIAAPNWVTNSTSWSGNQAYPTKASITLTRRVNGEPMPPFIGAPPSQPFTRYQFDMEDSYPLTSVANSPATYTSLSLSDTSGSYHFNADANDTIHIKLVSRVARLYNGTGGEVWVAVQALNKNTGVFDDVYTVSNVKGADVYAKKGITLGSNYQQGTGMGPAYGTVKTVLRDMNGNILETETPTHSVQFMP